MKFSVIIPAYNCEKFIKKCISSILKSNYNNIEIIIVDDGSVDKTKQIVDEMIKRDARIRLFSQRNSGVSVARNNGLAHATGDFIHFVDADDCINGDPYSFASKIIEEKNVDIIRFNYFCDNNGILENNSERKKFNDRTINNSYSVNQLIPLILNEDIKAYIWQLIIRRKKAISFDPKLSILEDENAVISILSKIQSGFLTSKCFYNYNISNMNSATKSVDKMEKMMVNMLSANKVIKSSLKKNNIANEKNLVLLDTRMAHSFCNYLEQLYKLERNFDKAKDLFEGVITKQRLKDVFKYFSYKKLNLKHKITTFLTMNKHYSLLHLIYYIKRRLIK